MAATYPFRSLPLPRIVIDVIEGPNEVPMDTLSKMVNLIAYSSSLGSNVGGYAKFEVKNHVGSGSKWGAEMAATAIAEKATNTKTPPGHRFARFFLGRASSSASCARCHMKKLTEFLWNDLYICCGGLLAKPVPRHKPPRHGFAPHFLGHAAWRGSSAAAQMNKSV